MESLAPPPAARLRPPTSGARILVSFIAAYSILLLPWHDDGLWLRPDLMALLLIYWGIHEPALVGPGSAFLAGILVDFADSHVLGIHSLGYSLLFYLIQFHRIRILSFYRLNQMLHVLVLLMVTRWSSGLLNGMLGYPWPAWPWWVLPPLCAALCWPLLPPLIDRSPNGAPSQGR